MLRHLFEPLYGLALRWQRVEDRVQWRHFIDFEGEHTTNQNELLVVQELTSSLHASIPLDETLFEIM